MTKSNKQVMDWGKVRALIMQWAQDDGTSDELMDLLPKAMQPDPHDFWVEFEERLRKAFPDRV